MRSILFGSIFYLNEALPAELLEEEDSDQEDWRRPRPVLSRPVGPLGAAQQAEWNTLVADSLKIKHWRIKGELVMVLVPKAMVRLYMQPDSSNLGPDVEDSITAAIKDLVAESSPNLPSPKDCRHPREEVLRLQKELALKGETLGLYHLFVWIATGQFDVTKKNINARSSGDHIKTTNRLDAITKFLARVKPLWETIGRLFQAIDPTSYDKYSRTVRARLKFTAFGKLVDSNDFVFAGFALIINLRVAPHRDVRDEREGWVAMAPHGPFEGGDLIVEELKARVPFLSGAVAFLKSQKLTHSIAPFTGTRYGLVCAMHANLVPTELELAQFAAEDAALAVSKRKAAETAQRETALRRAGQQSIKKARRRAVRSELRSQTA